MLFRTTIEYSKELNDVIMKMRRQTGAQDHAELIRYALSVYEYLLSFGEDEVQLLMKNSETITVNLKPNK